MDENKSQTAVEIPGMPKAYDPGQYAFIGVILSPIPVLLMSLSNSRVLKNGKELAGTMKRFLAAYIGLFVINHAVVVWAIVHATKGLMRAAVNDTTVLFTMMRGDLPRVLPSDVEFARTVVSNAGTIMFVLSIILLILMIRYTNRNEYPVYKEMKEQKKIGTRTLVLPVLVGIAFVVYAYGYSATVTTAIAQFFL